MVTHSLTARVDSDMWQRRPPLQEKVRWPHHEEKYHP
jgi:hypothetical protein